MVNLIIRELVSDGTITKQKEATADDRGKIPSNTKS
jgi:hypothetical protein